MKKSSFNFLFLVWLSFFLSSCASIQPTEPSSAEGWESRLDRLSQLNQWTLTARLALTTSEQSQTLTVHWAEHPDVYRIRISGSFGQTGALIRGSHEGVEITTAEGLWQGERLEDFVSSELHLTLPFTALRFWLLGIPAPGAVTQLTLDARHRLEHLEQYEWQISYRDYDAQTELPRRLRLEHEQWRINMVIQEWQLPTQLEAQL